MRIRTVGLWPWIFAGGLTATSLGCAQQRQPEPKADAGPQRRVVEIVAADAAGGEPAGAAAGPQVHTRYQTRVRDPIIEHICQRDRDWQDEQAERTSRIRDRQEAAAERERAEELRLVSSLPDEAIPESPERFETVWHQPPLPQFHTGTCWSFATTSLLESEADRIAGRRVKLAEMGFVYHEYLAKARRWLAERGDSLFAQGSQANAVLRMAARHGAWPQAAYPGVTAEDQRHDHIRLAREMKALLESLEQHAMWDAEAGLGMLRVLLDRHLGRPPERFAHGGRSWEPEAFLRRKLQLDPGAYVGFVSTLRFPFYTRGEFEVADNWWQADDYHNLPLEAFYDALRGAVRAGYSLVIAVDVSEPGRDGPRDAMFVPAYDIPPGRIDQLARELRLANGATTDDHGVHLVGWTEHAGHEWFLVKDSGRSSRRGAHRGYYFVRDDYIKLKVMAFTVHRDAVTAQLDRFAAAPAAASAD